MVVSMKRGLYDLKKDPMEMNNVYTDAAYHEIKLVRNSPVCLFISGTFMSDGDGSGER